MPRVQEVDNKELEQLRELIKTLRKEKGIRLDNFTSKDMSYHYLMLFLRGDRNLSRNKFEVLISNVNRFLDSMK